MRRVFSGSKLVSAVAWMTLLMASQGFSQTPPPLMTQQAAGRFLDQASWGPTAVSIAQLQQTGINTWLNAQFSYNTSDLPDQALLNSAGTTNTNLGPVQQAFFQNAVSGTDQLRQRVAFTLSEIFVVSAVGVNNAYAYPPYWRIFRDNAFGNYADIIRAVTLNPAMGHYLSMANNNKGNPAKGTAANENYGREVMQLFTLGLNQLNPDGSPVLDTNGNPVPTYDQATVTQMAKVLTGWTYPTAPGTTPATNGNNPAYYFGQMYPVQSNHDTSAKTIFDNITVPAGQTAEQDLNSLISALMAQNTMAPFVCTQLIQHLVTSNPSPGYISRCSNAFFNDGTGVRGNMIVVIRQILTDPEARASDATGALPNPTFGHLREPVLFMTNILRGLNATLTAKSAIYNDTNLLGQNLFYPATVFSYFSPQYRTAIGLLGPEFQIYSTQTASNRADIVNSAVFGTLDSGTSVNLAPWIQDGNSTDALLVLANSIFLHNTMSSDLNNAARAAISGATTSLARVQALLYTVLTSAEYQIIH